MTNGTKARHPKPHCHPWPLGCNCCWPSLVWILYSISSWWFALRQNRNPWLKKSIVVLLIFFLALFVVLGYIMINVLFVCLVIQLLRTGWGEEGKKRFFTTKIEQEGRSCSWASMRPDFFVVNGWKSFVQPLQKEIERLKSNTENHLPLSWKFFWVLVCRTAPKRPARSVQVTPEVELLFAGLHLPWYPCTAEVMDLFLLKLFPLMGNQTRLFYGSFWPYDFWYFINCTKWNLYMKSQGFQKHVFLWSLPENPLFSKGFSQFRKPVVFQRIFAILQSARECGLVLQVWLVLCLGRGLRWSFRCWGSVISDADSAWVGLPENPWDYVSLSNGCQALWSWVQHPSSK